MPFTPTTIPVGSTTYPETVDANFAQLAALVNSVEAQLSAVGGEGRLLPLEIFDRDGIVGAGSYQLDLEAYSGGSQITIGRRPAFQVGLGETNVSVAWMTIGGVKTRVQLAGDVVLNAAAIIAGIPKTIYVGIPSNGTPQLYENTAPINVLYIYEMFWDGSSLSAFKRRSTILAGHTLIQAIANAPKHLSIFDGETDFASDVLGDSCIVLPGAKDDNLILLDGALEVLGFFAGYCKTGPDGVYAPAGADNRIKFKVVANGQAWTETDFDFDASLTADEDFRKVNPSIGDAKFVTEVTRFRLERTFKGADVVSARAWTWGLYVRPLFGAPMPKDLTKVVI